MNLFELRGHNRNSNSLKNVGFQFKVSSLYFPPKYLTTIGGEETITTPVAQNITDILNNTI